MSVKELGRRLHRDPSVISRLYSAYAAAREQVTEALLAKQLQQQGNSKAPHQGLTVTVPGGYEDDCCIY